MATTELERVLVTTRNHLKIDNATLREQINELRAENEELLRTNKKLRAENNELRKENAHG